MIEQYWSLGHLLIGVAHSMEVLVFGSLIQSIVYMKKANEMNVKFQWCVVLRDVVFFLETGWVLIFSSFIFSSFPCQSEQLT